MPLSELTWPNSTNNKEFHEAFVVFTEKKTFYNELANTFRILEPKLKKTVRFMPKEATRKKHKLKLLMELLCNRLLNTICEQGKNTNKL